MIQAQQQVKRHKIKRFIVHQMERLAIDTSDCSATQNQSEQLTFDFKSKRLFGVQVKYKWKKVSTLCLTFAEARYNMELLQKSDKFAGAIHNYRIVCISL